MAIKDLKDWTFSERGKKDAGRHREKIKEAIRKNLPDIISEESIITGKRGKIVKVPVRGIKSYKFRYAEGEGGVGAGQGKGKKGDTIDERNKSGRKPGEAGDEPGVDYIETEIDIAELIEMMMEDLGLPNLQKKEIAEMVVPKGWTFDSIEKHGLPPHLEKKRTVKEALKRTACCVRELMLKTGCPQTDAEEAFADARGDLIKAQEALNQKGYSSPISEEELGNIETTGLKIPPFLFNEDLRYRTIKEDIEYQSNAVVLAMMDVSGSMNTMKKYLARSFFFWLVEFLRIVYRKVEIRFIAHTTEAKLVDEHEFFHKGESGGTFCHSAYDLATYLTETEYPPDKWNIYPFHFSDGEDFDSQKTVNSAKRLINRGVNMLGYGEIQIDGFGFYSSLSNLMNAFKEHFNLRKLAELSEDVYVGRDAGTPFVGVVIKGKTDIYPALKALLFKKRQWGS